MVIALLIMAEHGRFLMILANKLSLNYYINYEAIHILLEADISYLEVSYE